MASNALKLALGLMLLSASVDAQTISQLPAAGSLTGSEYTVVVQGGTTKRSTVGAVAGTATLPTIGGNQVLGNSSSSSNTASGIALPGCSGTLNGLTWTLGSGFGCNTYGTLAGLSYPGGTTFLRADGTWATPAGGGNVTGPASSTNNDLVLFNGTSGTIIKDSGVAVAGTTGTVNLVFSNSPTLVAPTLGIASATSILHTGAGTPSSSVDGLWTIYTNGTGWISAGVSDSVCFGNGNLTIGGLPPVTLGCFGATGNFSATGTITTGTNGGTGGSIVFNGSASGSITVNVPAAASGTETLPAGTGTVLASVTNPASNPVTGTPSSSTYLRGDGTWASVSATYINTQVRQTVLSGDTNFLTTGSGLTPAFTATKPLVITFANGFGSGGDVDQVTVIASGGSTAACTANNTNYVYATYSSATSVTWGCTTILPVYDSVAPTNTNGQYWFDTVNYQMNLGNGSSWTVVNVAFVGEVIAGASTITSATSYAFQGQYVSTWTNTIPSSGTPMSFTDNIGTVQKDGVIELKNLTAEIGYSIGDIVNPLFNTGNSGTANMVPPTIVKRRNTAVTTTGSSNAMGLINLSSGATTALTAANWAYRSRIKRNF